jgi:hypothetical protein
MVLRVGNAEGEVTRDLLPVTETAAAQFHR